MSCPNQYNRLCGLSRPPIVDQVFEDQASMLKLNTTSGDPEESSAQFTNHLLMMSKAITNNFTWIASPLKFYG